MAQRSRTVQREIYATDGFEYSPEYLEHFSWHQPEMGHQFVGKTLGKAKEWEALGFFSWLYEHFPRICLAERPGGQISPHFPGNMPGSKLLQHLREINVPESEAIRHLQVLEAHGILWMINKGDEILYLELCPPPKGM
ncbi:MAG: hypothetical protein QNJ30_19355 [Kiloniellales bacterium]|nr:hypothetical protein [Kiloniellales bacterium]